MGEFANRPWVQWLAWTVAVVILGLNFCTSAESSSVDGPSRLAHVADWP